MRGGGSLCFASVPAKTHPQSLLLHVLSELVTIHMWQPFWCPQTEADDGSQSIQLGYVLCQATSRLYEMNQLSNQSRLALLSKLDP